ncbi:jg18952 [Pararge aegeria aegeria]|uniref:Jg18952 protein n=1 Tax=Pararge aegeria aegeria TaxID=348720 RepID=A0A8S4SR42_9NEOP|nr:jg18952 [Pararge aegeria aegeria]
MRKDNNNNNRQPLRKEEKEYGNGVSIPEYNHLDCKRISIRMRVQSLACVWNAYGTGCMFLPVQEHATCCHP